MLSTNHIRDALFSEAKLLISDKNGIWPVKTTRIIPKVSHTVNLWQLKLFGLMLCVFDLTLCTGYSSNVDVDK